VRTRHREPRHDRVDTDAAADPGRRTVSETMLRNIRVIATDQSP